MNKIYYGVKKMRKRNFVVFACVCEKIFVPLHAFQKTTKKSIYEKSFGKFRSNLGFARCNLLGSVLFWRTSECIVGSKYGT